MKSGEHKKSPVGVPLAEKSKLLQLMQFSIEQSADAVYWIRPDASFVYVNAAACK